MSTVAETVARIDENVKLMREDFADFKETFYGHVSDDEKLKSERIDPLWDQHQRNIGAGGTRKLSTRFLLKAVDICLTVLLVYAAVRGIPHT